MRILRDQAPIPDDARGASAAIGNFDGVHLGHRAVVDAAAAEAKRLGRPLGVVTFEPHPRQVLAPDAPPFRLTNAEARARGLAALGVELLFEVTFTPALASLAPEAFCREVLARGLGLSHVVVGADFRFGHHRAGNADTLRETGRELGFGVTAVELLESAETEISSTKIRAALSEGRPRDAAAMLGHWHRIEGAVTRGDQRGRDLGYPTANLSMEGLHLPRFGIYAVKVDILTGPQAGRHDGVASLGVRPTFGENAPNLETYLFDFAGDLYGEHISVALVEFLRPEERFETAEALVAQMHADAVAARAALSR